MFSRRFLRIKVIKALYAHFKSENDSLNASEKNLINSIDKAYDLYLQMMGLIVDVARYAAERIEIARNKAVVPTALHIHKHSARRQITFFYDLCGIDNATQVCTRAVDVSQVGGILLVGNCHTAEERCHGVVQNDDFALFVAVFLERRERFRADVCAHDFGGFHFLAETQRHSVQIGEHSDSVREAETDVISFVRKVRYVFRYLSVKFRFSKHFTA